MQDATRPTGALVLVFDDDVACSTGWRGLLERLGYSVVECATSDAVVAAAASASPAAILTDVEVTGFDAVLRAARGGGVLGGVPIAVVSPDGLDDAPEGVHVLERLRDLEGVCRPTAA